MPSESELAQRLARLRFLGMTQAKTGHPDGRLNAGTNQTWIQTDNERAPTAVYGTVGARNVPVWTREMPDGSRVLDKPDYIIGEVTYGSALETVSQPQLAPIGKGNPVVIPSQNMDAGRLVPSPDGSLYVRITPYHYPGGYWNGFENIPVEPPAGTLNHRIALVGVDYQTSSGIPTGTVSYGHVYPRTIPPSHEEAARMAIATIGADWRGWLDLTGGQGSVVGSLVYDARWFSPGVFQGTDGTLTSYAGLVPPPAPADASKFLRGDGTWQSTSGGSGSALTVDAVFTQYEAVAVSNTVTTTTLVGNGLGSATLPANTLQQGTVLRIKFFTEQDNATSSPTCTIATSLGGAELSTVDVASPSGASSGIYATGEVTVVCTTSGASGAVTAVLVGSDGSGGYAPISATTAISADTTGTLAIDITATWSAANAGNIITLRTFTIEVLNP